LLFAATEADRTRGSIVVELDNQLLRHLRLVHESPTLSWVRSVPALFSHSEARHISRRPAGVTKQWRLRSATQR